MPVLEDIPISFSLEDVISELRLDPSRGAEGTAGRLIESVTPLISARAGYAVAYVEEKTDDSVCIGGVTFTSRILRVNLDEVERVFPYVITIGDKLEQAASSNPDLLQQYYYEHLGDKALSAAGRFLETHLQQTYGLEKLSSMSPGSLEDWPLTQQPVLFSLLEREESIGVKLTDSLLMLPRKSVSGMFFPTEKSFLSCQLCPRDRCPSRLAEYDAALLRKYHS